MTILNHYFVSHTRYLLHDQRQ